MSAALKIIAEVEGALHGASTEKRSDILRRVTDLFVASSGSSGEQQIKLFDGVMGQLISHVESRAAVELSHRLATMDNAPSETVRRLATHDDVEIAAPVLMRSRRLTDGDIIEIATLKSQAHLAKIATRPQLSVAVTDVLVDYGNAQVANELAVNAGAQFSNLGMAKLVLRADGDDRLAQSIAARSDIPPRLFQQLVAQAADIVRKKMLAEAPPERQRAVEQVLADISAQVAPKRPSAHTTAVAQATMTAMSQDTELFHAKLIEFANEKRVPETIAGLAVLGQLPAQDVEQLFYSANDLGMVVLCRSLGLDWHRTEVVISATPSAQQHEQPQIDDLHKQFDMLSAASAKRLLRFWQGRQAVVRAMEKSRPDRLSGAA
jgi:uncharacterized protein (DUF2336 family)